MVVAINATYENSQEKDGAGSKTRLTKNKPSITYIISIIITKKKQIRSTDGLSRSISCKICTNNGYRPLSPN